MSSDEGSHCLKSMICIVHHVFGYFDDNYDDDEDDCDDDMYDDDDDEW